MEEFKYYHDGCGSFGASAFKIDTVPFPGANIFLQVTDTTDLNRMLDQIPKFFETQKTRSRCKSCEATTKTCKYSPRKA